MALRQDWSSRRVGTEDGGPSTSSSHAASASAGTAGLKGRPTLLSPANIKALTYGLMNIVSARCGRAGGGQESNEGMQQQLPGQVQARLHGSARQGSTGLHYWAHEPSPQPMHRTVRHNPGHQTDTWSVTCQFCTVLHSQLSASTSAAAAGPEGMHQIVIRAHREHQLAVCR